MTETKWTKGEWRIVGEDAHEGNIPFIDITAGEVPSPECKAICAVECTVTEEGDDDDFTLTEEDWANAHLIASAPELFEALDALTILSERDLKMNQSDDEEYAGGGWWSLDTEQAIANAKTMLAKARGDHS